MLKAGFLSQIQGVSWTTLVGGCGLWGEKQVLGWWDSGGKEGRAGEIWRNLETVVSEFFGVFVVVVMFVRLFVCLFWLYHAACGIFSSLTRHGTQGLGRKGMES